MGYVVGVILGLFVLGLALVVGFDRDRAFYPTIAIIVASYYSLYAVIGGSTRALVLETAVGAGFLLAAVIGYKRSRWLVAAAIAGHGIFDLFHHLLIDNPGLPVFWPSFCMAFDVTVGAFLMLRLIRGTAPVSDSSPA